MLTRPVVETTRRRAIRYVAAVLAAVIAVLYFLIGFRILTVLDGTADQSFGIFAGIAYTLGAILLAAYSNRLVWILGAFLQLFVIFTYFNLAAQRTPVFEFWGILIRIIQVILLIALAVLAVRFPSSQASTSESRR